MASDREKIEALKKLKRADIHHGPNGQVLIWELESPFNEAYGKDWDQALEHLVKSQKRNNQ